MSCIDVSGSRLPNADLFDWQPSESQLQSLIADGGLSQLHCPFATTALTVCSAVALSLLVILLLWAVSLLLLARLRGVALYGSSSPFTVRYCLLISALGVSGITYNIVRLIGLTAGIAGNGSSDNKLLLLSFSARAGASYGMDALLWLVAVSFLCALGYSVDARVIIARKMMSQTTTQQAAPSLAFALQHSRQLVIAVLVFHAAVWLSLFLLPAAAASSSGRWPQLAIGLLLISLGNAGYWTLAVSVSIANAFISQRLKIAPKVSLGHPPSPHTAGLSVAQRAERNLASGRLLCASRGIGIMVAGHVLCNAAFFALTIATGVSDTSPVLPYWLFFTQWYWCCVCYSRMLLLRVPHVQQTTSREAVNADRVAASSDLLSAKPSVTASTR